MESSCCGFNFFGKKKRDHGSKSKPPPIVKRISKEHLLSYVSSEETLDKKLGPRRASKQELPRYRPPEESTEETTNNGDGANMSFDELRASMRQAASMAKLPLVLPLLNRGVKETSHEFRSQVPIPALSLSLSLSPSLTLATLLSSKFLIMLEE